MEHSVTFIGNATTLLRLGGITLLTDPNFLHSGQRAYLGKGLWSKRRTDPAMEIDALPDLDAVVLSHLHGDHFDRIAKRDLPPVPIITTPHAARRLRRRFPATGLATWDSRVIRNGTGLVRITAVPGQHAPELFRPLLPPVMGSMIDVEEAGVRKLRIYITGDTLYKPVLGEIPERFPGIDLMLIHLGGTRVFGITLTMDAEQGSDLVQLIDAGWTLPIHYDDYPVFRSPLSDFEDELTRRGLRHRMRIIRRGETLALTPTR